MFRLLLGNYKLILNVMNKKIIAVIAGIIIIGGGSFYAGMQYASGNALAQTRGAGNFGGGQRGARGGANGGFASGEVLSKDSTSITIKLRDPRVADGQNASAQSGGLTSQSTSQGGSKIIFFSDSTQVMKAISGSLGDVKVGEQVTVTGSTNSDGSISAQSIQIRPTMPIGQ